MGAQTKGNMADPRQRQMEREQEQHAYKEAAQKQYALDQRSQYEKLIRSELRDKVSFEDAYADRGPAGQKQAAQKQYEVDKRSQYENLPQSLRDKVSFEDAYADRGPAGQKQAAQKQYEVDKRSQYENLPQSLRDKVSFEDAYADRGPAATKTREAEVDQQRSRENAGIAFGPGRSNRGYVDLGRMSRDRMRRGNR